MQISFHQEGTKLELILKNPPPTCDLPGLYRKTVFLRSHPLSLVFIPEGQNKRLKIKTEVTIFFYITQYFYFSYSVPASRYW